jgi:predicted subunit of tRNA(5-methylaminomethyl-2-thiouridylate) methyltransferase
MKALNTILNFAVKRLPTLVVVHAARAKLIEAGYPPAEVDYLLREAVEALADKPKKHRTRKPKPAPLEE